MSTKDIAEKQAGESARAVRAILILITILAGAIAADALWS